MRMIAANAGMDGPVVIEKVRILHEQGKQTTGYDVLRNDYVDMLETGLADPAKATRRAVENACSIAAMILTTSARITDIPEQESPAPAGGMGGMGAWACQSISTIVDMTAVHRSFLLRQISTPAGRQTPVFGLH